MAQFGRKSTICPVKVRLPERSIADPDGYRLVLTSRSWSNPVMTKDLCRYTTIILRDNEILRDHGAGRGPIR
jgi:hypothetical protein